VEGPGRPTDQAGRGDVERLARRRARYLAGLLWHVGAYLIVVAGFVLLDLAVGEPGLQWATWIAAVWGFALAFHVLAYLIDGRQLEERRTRRYVEQARRPPDR
jgi:Flp pilus assembly protein TadB